MSVTIPLLTSIPSSTAMTESEYNTSWNTLLSELDPYATAANALAAAVEADAADAAAAVDALASAKWVSGTYAEGAVAWSPTDYFNYRCKTAGSRTVDPAADPTNWVLLTKTGAGGSDTTSSAIDITLTSASSRLQIIAMTAASKKVTQPAANTLQAGSLIFVYVNNGTYRFAVHKNGGAFVCHVNPGQIIAMHCSDISTGAGVWHVSGQDVERIYSGNSAEVINAVDSRLIRVVMLSATKAICAFRNNATTYLNAVILNYGSASGAAVAINAEASVDISIAAQTSSQATVVYKTSTGVTKGYVLDISGTTITPGSVATIDSGTGGGGTALTRLTNTQLLCFYQSAAAGNLRQRVLDISASAISASADTLADSTVMYGGHAVRAGYISATKALAAFRDSNMYIRLRLQSVSGSVPASTGSVITLQHPGTSYNAYFGMAILNSGRAVVISSIDRTYADMLISIVDISGTSPVSVADFFANVGLLSTADICVEGLGGNVLYVTWTGGISGGTDAVIVRITDDDLVIIGKPMPKISASVAATSGYLSCSALDGTHVIEATRNGSGYLSSKIIEISV